MWIDRRSVWKMIDYEESSEDEGGNDKDFAPTLKKFSVGADDGDGLYDASCRLKLAAGLAVVFSMSVHSRSV